MTGKRISRTLMLAPANKATNKLPLNYDMKYVGFETKKVDFLKQFRILHYWNQIGRIVFNSVNKFISIFFVISF